MKPLVKKPDYLIWISSKNAKYHVLAASSHITLQMFCFKPLT